MANDYGIDIIKDANGKVIRPATVSDNVANPQTRQSVTKDIADIKDDVSELSLKVSNINTEETQEKTDEMRFERNDGTLIGKIDDNGADFESLKKGGKEVLTAVKTINGESIEGEGNIDISAIPQETTSSSEESVEVEFQGRVIAKLDKEGLHIEKITDMQGNPIEGGSKVVEFSSLTDAEKEQLRGERGLQGQQGQQGNSGYQGNINELQVVNNLTQGGATSAFSAEMGKVVAEAAEGGYGIQFDIARKIYGLSNVVSKEIVMNEILSRHNDIEPLIIIGGQSNACGMAKKETAPEWFINSNYILANYKMFDYYFDTEASWAKRGFSQYQLSGTPNNGNRVTYPLHQGNYVAFDLFFAKKYLDENGGNIYAIRQSEGGVSIGAFPSTGSEPFDWTWYSHIQDIPSSCNSMCKRLLERIYAADQWAKVNRKKLLPVAILWHQGEADSGSELFPKFKDNLLDVVKFLRNIFNAPYLPFICGQLNMDGYDDTAFGRVNGVFDDIAKKDDFFKVVNMQGHYTSVGDKLHYDAPAHEYMGEQMYEFFKQLNNK